MLTIKQARVSAQNPANPSKEILKNINLSLTEGEFVVVIGNNGAGKSTLLNLISGTMSPSSGSIIMDNTDVTGWPSYKRAQFVSKVLQSPSLATIGSLTVAENLAFALERGKRRNLLLANTQIRRDMFKKILREVNLGLETRLDDAVESLSGGQRQVLSLIMATLSKSQILLLDEHTAALDPKTAALTMSITNKIIKENKLTTLMITHNMADALAYGDRTIFIQNGMIIKELSTTEKKLLTPSDLAALFNE